MHPSVIEFPCLLSSYTLSWRNVDQSQVNPDVCRVGLLPLWLSGFSLDTVALGPDSLYFLPLYPGVIFITSGGLWRLYNCPDYKETMVF